MNDIYDVLQKVQNDTGNFERGRPFTQVFSGFAAEL